MDGGSQVRQRDSKHVTAMRLHHLELSTTTQASKYLLHRRKVKDRMEEIVFEVFDMQMYYRR